MLPFFACVYGDPSKMKTNVGTVASVLQGISKLLWRGVGHSNWAIRGTTGGLKLAIHPLNSRALLRLSPVLFPAACSFCLSGFPRTNRLIQDKDAALHVVRDSSFVYSLCLSFKHAGIHDCNKLCANG
jgi:hypothetical protein